MRCTDALAPSLHDCTYCMYAGMSHHARSYSEQATSRHCWQHMFSKQEGIPSDWECGTRLGTATCCASSPRACVVPEILSRCTQSPNTSDVVLAYGADGQCQNTVISFDTPADSAQGFRDFGVPTLGPGPDIPLYTAMFDACEHPLPTHGNIGLALTASHPKPLPVRANCITLRTPISACPQVMLCMVPEPSVDYCVTTCMLSHDSCCHPCMVAAALHRPCETPLRLMLFRGACSQLPGLCEWPAGDLPWQGLRPQVSCKDRRGLVCCGELSLHSSVPRWQATGISSGLVFHPD